MIDIKDKKDCCGCNACGDVCPKMAIAFDRDNEGFLYPVVDKVRCINCGLCDKVCPQLHAGACKRNEFAEPKCYAAVHKNYSILFDSTSGGAFTALANVIYARGGYVGGAIWNDDFSIRQFVSNDKKDLVRLRSSKYAQSDAQGWYRDVKKAVETGSPVLVCGCPCQIAALKLFIGKIPDNLILVDFICRGNNSPLVFRKYLDWQEERNGGKVVYVKPKNKELGWRNLTTKLVFDNGKIVYDTRETSYFTKGYLSTNAYCRPSCYDCKFKGLPRIADISIADFWGANSLKLPAELDRNLGTSLIMMSNTKGHDLYKAMSASMIVQPITWQQASAGNGMIDNSLSPPVCDRNEFFKVLNEEGFRGVATKYIAPNTNLMTCSLTRRIMRLVKANLRMLWHYRWSPVKFAWIVKDNGLRNVLKQRYMLITHPGVHLELEGDVQLGARLNIGNGYFKKPILATAFGVKKGGKLITSGKESMFMYGADVEVFDGGILEIGSDCGFNLGATIICGNHIKIGNGVKGGRHVTIRDNNGGHYMNLPGYKDSKPVEIGDHVWLCEGCTIMPGVKIGAGAVVGAKAVVFNNVPANTLVVGNPAQVVCSQIEWKY